MKRAVVTGIVCALLVAGVAWATQTWRDNVSMGGFSLTDPTHAGGGPLCAQYDNTGKLTSAGAPCGAGLGGSAGVSSVTGTPLRVSALPTTGAVVVDTIGGFYSGATSGGNQDLGALTSGVGEIIQSGGVASMTTYQAAANEIQVGAASGGGLAQFANLISNGTKFSLGQAAFDAAAHFVLADDTTPTTVSAWDGRHAVFGQSGTTGGATAVSFGNAANTAYVTFAEPGVAWSHARFDGDDFAFYSLAATLGFHQDSSGNVYDGLLTSNGLLKTTGGTGLHAIAAAGTDYQLPLVACTDYVSLSCVSGTTDLGGTNATPTVIGIENTAAMRGDIVATEIVAPGTPAAGKLACYGDSSSLNWACKDELGNVKHGVRTTTATASQFFTALSDSGQFSRAQPAFTDVSGSLACGQLPAFTGDMTTTGGTCATVNVSAAGAFGVNGATVPSNTSLSVGVAAQANRDRMILVCGGGALGATGTSDNTFLDIIPQATAIRSGVTGGIYATERVRAVTYSSGGGTVAPSEATTLYVDNAPSTGGSVTTHPRALHVAGGQTLLDGAVTCSLLAGGGIVATDTSATGTLGIAGVAGIPAAVAAEQDYYINVTGSTLVTGGPVWLATSSTAGQGSTPLEYAHQFAASTVALTLRITTNAITSGTLAVQITRNGSTFTTFNLTSGSSGTVATGSLTVGSPLLTDRWGALVNGAGTGMSGSMAFTATLLLAPNVF